MNSLRWRLILSLLSGLTLVVAGGGAVAYLNIRERLYREFDAELAQRAVSLAALIETEGGRPKIEGFDDGEPPGVQRGTDYFAVWSAASGNRLAASKDLAEGALPRFGGSLDKPEWREVRLPGSRPGRGVGVEFDPRTYRGGDDDDADEPPRAVVSDPLRTPPGGRIQLVVARADTVVPTLAAIRRPLLGLWVGCTALGGVLIWRVVQLSLRPLDQLKAQLAGLEDGGSGRRIVLPQQPAELRPVTDELNRLLDRVEQALDRERTLTSNVAHEMRTPIAGLLSTLEVTLNRLRSPEEYRESTEECFEIAKRMHWLINNLLSLTRIEAGDLRLQNQLVSVELALPEWWKPFAARAAERGLRVEWDIEPGATFHTDPEFLRVVVNNLFDNALSYAAAGGTVRIEADSRGTLAVSNPTIDLKAEAVERVFDPFWRNRECRDHSGSHAGLGLSLCRKIMGLLGGGISARLEDGLFKVRLEMV